MTKTVRALRRMLSPRSIRGRSTLAALALLMLLLGVAAVALWRFDSERGARETLERRAFAVSALENARAQLFSGATYIAIAAYSDDPSPYVAQFQRNHSLATEAMANAREKLAAVGDAQDVAVVDEMIAEVETMLQAADPIVASFPSLSKGQRIELAGAGQTQMWPEAESVVAKAEQFVQEQSVRLSLDKAAADEASKRTLALLVSLSVISFLVAAGILLTFILSLVRPLRSLQASARAISSGNLEARAEVSGLQETASLARDFNDMTQKLIERSSQLQESESQFRNVLEMSRDAIYKLNLQTRTFDYVSPSAFRLTGFTIDELKHLGLYGMESRVHRDDLPKYKISPSKLPSPTSEDGPASVIEYRWKRKDGQYRWFSDNRALIRDDEGKPLATAGTVRDITERKKADAALRASEERFRTLSASAPLGIFLMDENDQVIYMNERLREIGGSSRGGGPGEEFAQAMHPDDFERVVANWMKADKEHAELLEEFRILTPEREMRWVRMRVSPILSDEDKKSGVVGTIEDITERKEAEHAIARRLQMESATAQASNILAGPEEVGAALNLALPALAEAFGAEGAAVFAAKREGLVDLVTHWRAAHAPKMRSLPALQQEYRPWITERMMQGEPLIVPDVGALPSEAAAEKANWQRLGIRSLLAMPLMSGGRSIGCVIFDNVATNRIWRDEDVRLLRLASESIASCLQRQRAEKQRTKAYESIVLLLATAAEARDPYTEHHLQRVRGYAEAIALEFGLTASEAQEIGLLSLLHDLGKIRVPDSVLVKPGPLSEEEWQIMRKHTVWGEELLPDDPWFKTAREITRWHHENWDGTGYPDGLHGDMIPRHAAIVALADGFDAMTSRRPYRGPWPPVRAVREIAKRSGKTYSPAVVEAFRRAINKGEIDEIVVTGRTKTPGSPKAA